MRAILASRADDAPTSADAAATSMQLHEPQPGTGVRHLPNGSLSTAASKSRPASRHGPPKQARATAFAQ